MKISSKDDTILSALCNWEDYECSVLYEYCQGSLKREISAADDGI